MDVMTFLTALRVVFSKSEPTAFALTPPAMKKKVHPASRIFRSSPRLSRFLTSLQPFEYGSLSNRKDSGKRAPSLMRIVPALILSAIGFSLPSCKWHPGPPRAQLTWSLRQALAHLMDYASVHDDGGSLPGSVL